MARIQVNIEGDDAQEVLHTLRAFTQGLGALSQVQAAESEPETPTTDSPPAEAPKTRGRKPKDAPATETAPASGSLEPTDAGGPSDLEKELMGEAAPETTPAMVMSAMQAHLGKHGADKTMGILVAHGAGAKSFKQIDVAHYPAVYAALQAELP